MSTRPHEIISRANQ